MLSLLLLSLLLNPGIVEAVQDAEASGPHTLTRLSGAVETGEVVELGSQRLRLRRNGQEVETDTADLLTVTLRPQHTSPFAPPYLEVRLVDDAFFRCIAVGFRGKQIQMRLFNGLGIDCPLDAVRSLLCDAQDEANRTEFKQLLERNTPADVLRLVSRDGTTVNAFEGIVGEADDEGRTLKFKADDTTANISLARVRGIIFHRREDPEARKLIGRVVDTFQNVIPFRELTHSQGALQLVTPAGLKITLPIELVHQVDYSPGKLAYLSDLEPTLREFRFGIKEDLVRSLPEKYGRDATLFLSQNGTSRQIRIGGRVFAKGLNVHSPTVLEFDVSGYNWFRCVLGMDDGVARPGRAGVRIEGDGRELFSTLVTGGDKPKELAINIAGVRRLRLIVDRGDDDDELGDHVSFGDARVTK